MLFETICTNGLVFAKALKRTHVSSIMEEANEFESNETKKKKMETIISMMTDAMKQVFSYEAFEQNCRKFLNLKDTELKSDRVKEVSEFLLSAIPGGDGLLDDILKSMEQFTPGRTTLLDVTRAITSVAQDQPHDRQVAMEELAGTLTNGSLKVPERHLFACNITKIGDHAGVPWAYIKRLLTDDRDQQLVNLAAVNLNEFYERRSGEMHTRGKKVQKQVFVRALKNEQGVPVVRAMLSDKYFVLNNLDIALTALAIVTKTGDGGTAAKDARAFDWHLDPFRFELGFVNPGVAFDLKNPDKGLIRCEGKRDDHGWVYPGGGSFDLGKGWTGRLGEGDKSQHLVFPACFISNSETGGGSASVEMSFMEAVCLNTARLGQSVTRRHLGGLMETADDYTSDETKRKLRETWLSVMADSLKQVFDEKAFEENCRKFLGLATQEIKDVKKVTEHLISAIPGADALLDEVLKAYNQFTTGKNTVMDVQRALTSVAQDQPYEKAAKLETIAGRLITGEIKVGKELLLTSGVRPLPQLSASAQQSEVRAA